MQLQTMTPQLLLYCCAIGTEKRYFSEIPQTEFAVHLVQNEHFLKQLVAKGYFSLLIMDCSHRENRNIELIRGIRKHSGIPILATSHEQSSDARAVYFESGADDVVNLPIGRREFVARIRSKIGVKQYPLTAIAMTRVLNINGVKLDPNIREVICNDKIINLTSKEFNILHTLMRHSGVVVNKKQLYRQAFKTEVMPFTRGVDTHICNIRKKLKTACKWDLLHTVRGVGYIFLAKPKIQNWDLASVLDSPDLECS